MSRPIANSMTPASVGTDARGFDRDAIELEARRLQALAVADALRGLGRAIARLPLVADLRLRAARARLVRRTVRELQELDDASLADIGLTRGEIRARAVAACEGQYPRAANGGFFGRLAESVAEARQLARARRELATFDERLLRDIGIDRSGAFEAAEQEPVLAQRPTVGEPAAQTRYVVQPAAAQAANDRRPADKRQPAAA